ncbi:MAG: competence/damage-inducible protein A [Bacteroidota bacterium]|nr:competence/damage-inducible protein A [Bacteroidota bacterium]
MDCALISIGDELLIGQTVNTNAAWLGEQLNLLGYKVVAGAVIPDDENAILNALDELSIKADLIIITGGLGPTKDDITKHTLCDYFDTKLERNLVIEQQIVDYFNSRQLPILQTNKDQALIPLACELLPNSRGTASGMWFEKDEKIFISLPGVPYEMKGIITEIVIPKLLKRSNDDRILVHKTIRTHGMGESFLAEVIKNWEDKLSHDDIKLAYLPSPGIVKLRLSLLGKNQKAIILKLEEHIQHLQKIIPNQIYGYEDDTMEGVVGQLLSEKNETVATAESCTGGAVAKMITSVSGSSAYFEGSIISYSNQIKINQLQVEEKTLNVYGAVSQQVVEQMAIGVRRNLNTHYGLATSGIAGPTGGTPEKPVGTIWIATAGPNGVKSKKLNLGYSRERNIHVTSLSVLNMLRLELLQN